MASPLLHKIHNHKSAVVGGVMVPKMGVIKVLILLALIAPALVTAENEVECNRVFVDSMGLALYVDNGELFTGTLVCGPVKSKRQTSFVKGIKHGTEVMVSNHEGNTVTAEKVYLNGIAKSWCAYKTIGEESIKRCKEIDCAVEDCK